MPKRQKCTAAAAAATGRTQRRSPQLSDIEGELDETLTQDETGLFWPNTEEGGGGFLRVAGAPPREYLVGGAN